MFQDAPPPPPAPLPDVVVTAARLPPAAGEAAFSVIRLDPHRLARDGRLDQALAAAPAVSLFRRTSSLAANPTTQGLSLRAIAPSGAGRTLVTLDGEPINDPFGGWVIWSQIPPESLDGLDIVRGAGAGPYGAGALTGVIALRERDRGGVLDLSLGGRGGARLAGSAVIPAGAARLTLSALTESSDGYIPVRGAAAGAADTPLDLDAHALAVRLDAPLDTLLSDARLSLRASTFEEDRGSGLAGARATASGNSVSIAVARSPSPDAAGWRVQAWRRESDLVNGSVAVAADRALTTPANDQFATPAVGWGLNAAVRRSGLDVGGGRLEWELGADARFNEGETRERFRHMAGAFTRDRIAGGRTSVAGAYGEISWTGGPWLVAGGARLDRWANLDGVRIERNLDTGAILLDEADPDRSGRIASARLGVRRDLGEGWALRSAAYTGFRPATLNELHRPFRVGNDLTEANAALTPERLTGAEIGLSRTTAQAAFSAAVFWNRLDDAVVNVTIGQGPGTFPRAGFVPADGVLRQRMNAGTIKAVGVELDGRLNLTDRLDLTAAASITDARVDGGAGARQLTGQRPAQAPIWSATAGLDWRASERLRLSAGLRYESRRFEDDLNSRVLDRAVTVDLRGEWRMSSRATLWLAADNLMDAEIPVSMTASGVAGFDAPRTVRGGVRVAY